MLPNIRTSVLVLVFICSIAAVVWFTTRSATKPGVERPPIAEVDHSHSEDFERVAAVDLEPLDDFQSWLESYRAGERGAAFLDQGKVLAERRRESMLQLIQRDPSSALAAGIGYSDYANLPEELQNLVEQPFSKTGDLLVTAICDHDDHTPQYHLDVYLEDNSRLRLAEGNGARTGLSKLDVPLQGIELDGWAAIEPTVFEQLEGDDVEWALSNLPSGNPDPTLDFLTGEPLGSNPVTTAAGGFTFQFSDEENLAELEGVVRSFDDLPGKTTGSSVIFSVEVQELQGKGFPVEAIRESQLQLTLNDTTGDRTSLFIRIVYSDKLDAPKSKEDLENQINVDVSGRLVDFSYNKTSMTATATSDTYQMSRSSADYTFDGADGTVDPNGMMDEAIALYEAAGSPEGVHGSFDIVGIIFPKLESWGSGAGLGTVGGAHSRHWLNGTPSTGTILHEYGHNYGLNHSNYWVFNGEGNEASTNPIDPNGKNEEYGDFWDVMGKGDENRGHFHMAAKNYIRWLPDEDTTRIDEAGDSGTFRVFRFDHVDAMGLQMLEIAKSGGENYFVGFRRGFQSNNNYYQGAYILWERPASGGGSPNRNQGWIIDTTPESDSERQDSGISLGRTYSDTDSQVHITPVAVGGSSPNEYLDVVVNVGDFSGNNAPQIGALIVPTNGEARDSVALSVTASDQDGGDQLAYSWDLGNGEVYPSSESINVSFGVGGTYDVTVTVSDMKGGITNQSAQIEISDPVNTWSTRASGTGGNLQSLASNGTHVVAGGRGVILRSSDGMTWEDVSPNGLGFLGNMIIEGICWTGSEFIAAGAEFASGSGQYTILSSPDGSGWTRELIEPIPSAPAFPRGLNDVASNEDGTKVIAVGADGGIYIRIDDGDWTKVDIGLVVDDTLGGIAYGNGAFVVGGRNSGAGQELLLFRTTDGTNWEDLKDNSDLMTWWGLDTVDFFDGFFVGSGFSSRTAFSENGGINWQSLEQGNTHQIHSFAFGNGVYYSIGKDLDNGNALVNLVSTSGKIWDAVDSLVAEPGNAVHFFKNTFIVVGDGGSIRQSGLVQAGLEILAAPVISPSTPEFVGSVDVTITTDAENAEIRYTLEGSEPTSGSTLFEEAINITETTTVKAKVFKDGIDSSPTATSTYTKSALTGFAAWIDQYYQGGDSDGSANPDGDWASNLFEWALGSLPNEGDSAPVLPEFALTSGGIAEFKIHRLAKEEAVNFIVETSSNLAEWTEFPTTVTTDSDTLLELVSDDAIQFNPTFLRIRVSDSL